MMHLEGSCHCGSVRFTLSSRTPYPHRWCYCSRCQKTHGGLGGVAHIMGEADTLAVEGSEDVVTHTTANDPADPDEAPVELQLNDCASCGSHLWLYSPSWSRWVYPAASAIDTPLPTPPEYVHICLDEKPDWVAVPTGPEHVHVQGSPTETVEDWHRRHGLLL